MEGGGMKTYGPVNNIAVAAVFLMVSSCSGGGPGSPLEQQEAQLTEPPTWAPEGNVLCQEDFRRFPDRASFMLGANCLSNLSNLDGRGNVDAGPSGLIYRFPAEPNRCNDQIVGQANISLPAGSREVWIEWEATFSDNFTTRNPNCGSPSPDYKFVLVWLNDEKRGGHGRSDFKMGTNGSHVAASTVGFPQHDDVPVNPGSEAISGDPTSKKFPPETVKNPVAEQFFDGKSHRYRLALRMLGGSQYSAYAQIDDVVTHRYTTNSLSDVGLWYVDIMLGSNRNLGAVEDMYLIWENVKVWAR
jgi:hypothetical protein